MRAILIPVKEFTQAKKRLSPRFPPEARAALAAALCEDFFAIVGRVRNADRFYVVSKEPVALLLASERGWSTIIEREQYSESQSVDVASRICAGDGIQALLRVPADIPLTEPEDIEAILAEWRGSSPAAIIVPSHDRSGTNALLRAPPTLFPSHFGRGSFARHLKEAEKARAPISIVENARIARDIDEIEDIEALARTVKRDCATARWLRAQGYMTG
jgi:2-phospho-L-lactate guanylyltransferase